jgi:hypothetical protein
VADRLNLHALAAECEWGLTQLWETKHVYTRAALDTADIRASIIEQASKYKVATESAQTMLQWRLSKEGLEG